MLAVGIAAGGLVLAALLARLALVLAGAGVLGEGCEKGYPGGNCI